ncbi:MAG: Cof-type HAD-IIB family hydrolase [Acidobacteria bacterium]|nr:Cof-type HAD-IIB family hydrolase [Acidobacteriota bacterium]
MIRLIALDLDGTLLDSRGHVSERNRRAILDARGRGVEVALVTGRRFRDARPVALELGLDVPLVAHNGALTKHARTLETVAAVLLPLDAARETLRVARAHDADALVSDDPEGAGVLVYDHIDADDRPLAEYIEWSRRIHGEEAARSVRQVASLEDYLDHAPVHITFSGTQSKTERLAEVFARELGASVKLMTTVYPRIDFGLIDVIHPEVSKGTGLAAVADELNLPREDVMAVGDNHNDREMLEYAGTRVVVSNAEPALHELEGVRVVASHDEDGVAEAIENFVLAGEAARVR